MKFNRVRKFLKRLHQDEAGAMSAEKVLILALISLPIIIALVVFRSKIMEWFTGESAKLNQP